MTGQSTTSDTKFILQTSVNPVEFIDISQYVENRILQTLTKVQSSEKLLRQWFFLMLNAGNFIELQASISNAQSQAVQAKVNIDKWLEYANAIVQLQQSQTLHNIRIRIQNYAENSEYFQKQQITRQQLIDQYNKVIISKMPDQSSATLNLIRNKIDYFQVSSKIYACASEIFASQVEQSVLMQCTDLDFSLIDNAQKQGMALLRSGVRQQYSPSNGVVDMYLFQQMFFESLNCATMEAQRDFYNRVYLYPDSQLVEDVMINQTFYMKGVIPNSLTPIKVYALQDSFSILYLQRNILDMAETHILTANELISNNNVANRMTQIVIDKMSNGFFSGGIQQTLNQSKFIQQGYNKVSEAFQNTRKDIVNSDPSYTGQIKQLAQDAILQSTGTVVDLTIQQQAQLKIALSILLACVRYRYAATQESDYELVQQEDINELYKILKLTKYIKDPHSTKNLDDLAQMLIETLLAHNVQKQRRVFNGIDMKQVQISKSQAELQISQQLKSLSIINTTENARKDSSQIESQIMDSIYLAATMQMRYDNEVEIRRKRMQILVESIDSMQKEALLKTESQQPTNPVSQTNQQV